MKIGAWFTRFASAASRATGRAGTFVMAALVVLAWAVTGPMFHYSDTWQLVINTGTTIVTFLMVFLIQNTQNRDSQAMHLKMDEIIRAMEGAHNRLIALEDADEDVLQKMVDRYRALAENAERRLKSGGSDIGCDEIEEAAADAAAADAAKTPSKSG
ncbi:low affinity iron permease family protein [Dokdonella sp.]|uniref:low affinity iron permease family protein n=1 Tax=Dokdonella sp. TaxID=2291710 RepID=UPI002621BB5A|nr:low affinity iron permease family protein [Dokdonella sp.]